jgi:hypothetical protein
MDPPGTTGRIAVMTDDPASTVGYKRPPRHTRFRPGQSGNPSGRPKGTQNLATDLGEELAERIPIRERERRLHVSKQRAILKTLVSKALEGDTRAASIVLRLVEQVIVPEAATAGSPGDDLSADDRAILDRFIAEQLASRT